MAEPSPTSDDEIEAAYRDWSRTTKDICRELHISGGRLRRVAQERDCPPRPTGGCQERNPNTTSPEIMLAMAEMYRDNPSLSMEEVGRRFGRVAATVRKACKRHGVKIRRTVWGKPGKINKGIPYGEQEHAEWMRKNITPHNFHVGGASSLAGVEW